MPPEGRVADLAKVLNTKFQEIKEQARKTLYSAVISAGGLLIKDGGEFRVVTEDDVNMFYLGPMISGSTPFRGFVMRRETGSQMLANGIGDNDPAKVFLAWRDRTGNVVISDDATSGAGLTRPWLVMPSVPVLSSSIPVTSGGTWISVYSTGWIIKQQPSAEAQALLYSTGGGVGEARFTVNGSPVGSVIPIASGAFSWSSIQSFALPGNYNGYVRVELQVQRTNGAGSVGGVLIATQRQA